MALQEGTVKRDLLQCQKRPTTVLLLPFSSRYLFLVWRYCSVCKAALNFFFFISPSGREFVGLAQALVCAVQIPARVLQQVLLFFCPPAPASLLAVCVCVTCVCVTCVCVTCVCVCVTTHESMSACFQVCICLVDPPMNTVSGLGSR